MKNFLKTILLFTIIFVCLVIAIFLWLNRPTGNIPINGAEFEIINGDTAYSISQKLYAKGYIHSKQLFIIIVRALRIDKNLKIGWVELRHKDNLIDIIYSIYTAKFISIYFTVPEG